MIQHAHPLQRPRGSHPAGVVSASANSVSALARFVRRLIGLRNRRSESGHIGFRLCSVVLAFAFVSPGAPMADEIFISSHNAASNRYAVFEDDERVAFLYLSESGSQKPVKDAVAYSRTEPVERIDWERIRATGETPPLSRDLASSAAVISSPVAKEFAFKWSADGNAVAILRNGSPLAFAAASEKFGYSKAVRKDSALANAWNQAAYDRLFSRTR